MFCCSERHHNLPRGAEDSGRAYLHGMATAHHADRLVEAKKWFAKCTQVDVEEITDAAERAQ